MDGLHCFVVDGGLVVHNSDGLRYALASYPYAVRQPETEPVIPAGMDRADWRTMVTMTDTDSREMPGGMLI